MIYNLKLYCNLNNQAFRIIPKEYITAQTQSTSAQLESSRGPWCHVVQKMRRSESHESDTMLELVANVDNLMRVHVKIISWIVVLLKELDETDGVG